VTTAPAREYRGYRFGEFFFDLERRSLFRDSQEIPLRPRSFQILSYLVANHGRLVTRDELMQAVWADTIVTDDSLTQCIIDIRRALGDTEQELIRTLPRQGYLFEAPVTAEVRTAPEPTLPPAAMTEAARSRRGWRARSALPALLVLGVTALLVWLYRPGSPPVSGTPASPPVKSVAVLPFADMSPAGERQYFADGLAEEILNLLARSRDLKVIARTSSFSLRDRQDLDAREIGRLLGVTHLLEGSIRQADGAVRVTAQLIETGSGTHLWSDSFDSSTNETLAVQGEIAQAVAAAMKVALGARTAEGSPQRVDFAAYDAYVRGRYLHSRRGPGDLQRARELYLLAVDLDPEFAAPWAWLAGVYQLQLSGADADYESVLELMGNAARTALGLDPDLAEAHLRLAAFFDYSGDRQLAQEYLESAERLNPNSPLLLGRQAGRAAMQGRYDEALEIQRRLIELDPLGYVARYNYLYMLILAGRYADAEVVLAGLEDLRADHADVALLRFRLRLLQGRLDEAAAVLDTLTTDPWQLQSVALLHSARQNEVEADLAMQALAEEETPLAARLLAEVHAYRGEYKDASRWLEHGYQLLGPSSRSVHRMDWRRESILSPFLQALRDDPALRGIFSEEL